MRYILLVLCIFCFSIQSYSETLHGGVAFSIENAKLKTFENIQTKIYMKRFEKYLFDPNYKSNTTALNKGKQEYKNRYLTKFSSHDYGLIYKNNLLTGYYYSTDGHLVAIEIYDSEKFPHNARTYNIKGDLIRTSYEESQNTQYSFDINKNLYSYWLYNNCYNAKGELVLTRD